MRVKADNYLKYITDERYNKLKDVLSRRTRFFTFVFENFYDPHNISAGLRSIEGFGFQDVYIVKGQNPFKPNKAITRGSHKWLTLKKFDKTVDAIGELHKNGYKVLVAEPDEKYPSLEEMEFNEKTAFLFGQEGYGVSEEAHKYVDGVFYIPIRGFIESFNVSVSVSLTVYFLRLYLEKTLPEDIWLLSDKEREELLDFWLLNNTYIKKVIEKETKDGKSLGNL